MLEILMITMIVGIWLLSIVVAVSKAKAITNQTKQEVIATQLAKEWIEMVYQIRNSNLLQHPNYKNFCWLNVNPNEICDDSNYPDRMTEKEYILSWQTLSWTTETLDIWDGMTTWEQIFNLCLTWWKRITCPWLDNQTRYGKFFRTIEWKWLYTKNHNLTGGLKIFCQNWSAWWDVWSVAYSCGHDNADLHPMEFHFCSRVEYIWTKTGSVEICGVLTNFFED
mgnify:CR=1 FL=1